MKSMPGTFRIYFACLQHLLSKQWFYTVSGRFLQIKSANMLASTQPGISDMSRPFVNSIRFSPVNLGIFEAQDRTNWSRIVFNAI